MVVFIAVLSSDPAAGVGIFAALAAGIVSFLSPCVLPLVPGYLSAVTGVSAGELENAGWRRVLGPSLLFVASFSAIFIALGLTATGLGSTLQDHEELLTKIAAALIIALGVLFIAALFVPRLNREWHVEALLDRAGRGGPIVAGAAFAIAWTPCIGPTLGAILTAASISGSAAHGAFLLAVYSAGLAIPFLLTALAFSRMTTAFAVVKRHYSVIVAAGGAILIVMGVLIWTGELTQLNVEAQRWLSELGLDFWNEV
jgi:cytochrome c-type biogenesis protein